MGYNIYPRYQGYEIKPSRTADREMVDLKLYLDDIIKVLEYGQDSSRSKRKPGTIEKQLRIRGKAIKVVVVESITRWNNEKVWLIIHVGDTRER